MVDTSAGLCGMRRRSRALALTKVPNIL